MSEIEKINAEALSEIATDLGIELSNEQSQKLSKTFTEHLSMMREVDSYSYSSPSKDKCSKCEALKWELAQAKKEIEIYNKSVMRRRNAERVWTENGEVRYE